MIASAQELKQVLLKEQGCYMYHGNLLLMFYNRNVLKNLEERDYQWSGINGSVTDKIALYMLVFSKLLCLKQDVTQGQFLSEGLNMYRISIPNDFTQKCIEKSEIISRVIEKITFICIMYIYCKYFTIEMHRKWEREDCQWSRINLHSFINLT